MDARVTPAGGAGLQLTIAARVAEHLRSEIRDGELTAGAPLRQNDVAARLGVSSTPVREAFHILERAGLVEREGRRGVRVFRPSIDDLINAYEVRGALESYAARLAAVRVEPGEVAELREVMRRMHSRRVSQDTFLALNATFHESIARASRNPRLTQLVVAEQAATTSYIAFLGVDPSSARDAEAEHADILSAVAAGDEEVAAVAMADHLVKRADALRARLRT